MIESAPRHRDHARRSSPAIIGRSLRGPSRGDHDPAQHEWGRAQLDPWYAEDDPTAPDATLYADLDTDGSWFDAVLDVRSRADSKHPHACPDCPGWYATRATLAKHRATMHGTPPMPSAAPMVAAPVVTAAPDPAPPMPTASRPSCPRCGQTFRLGGTGFSWHLANRLDCARPMA